MMPQAGKQTVAIIISEYFNRIYTSIKNIYINVCPAKHIQI